ncbi:MAG TPA: HlyC/CorC family transporter [Acholeplasmatales bacterium]|jgi:hypothetical protein|nr:HlyC/CorC family transporter [Bacilli bacterium]MBS6562731.1 HlyC/CorC family transporter [Staphylococcus sp.]CDC71850.1 uncharacterized protein BN609_01396 [Staphylococcus sp. CAG:324]HAR58218.1 HlyC/CorC family transporter [Acholeplasmatales bacterium]
MNTPVVIAILILIVILIILSAFFSSCEIAYSSVNKIKLKKKVSDGNKEATKAMEIVNNYSEALSTILIGNNLVNIAVSSLATMVAVAYLGEEMGSLLATIVATIVVLIFGEILPKALANKFSLKLTLLYVKPFKICRIIFFPITFLVTKFVKLISKIWTPKNIEVSEIDEELNVITEELEEEGVIDEEDAELIISAIDFRDVTAHEIMIPRVDVFAIDIDDNQEDILKNEQIFRYSRVPVYEDTIDHVIGILNTTSLMKKILNGEQIDLRSMLIEPMYVHKTKHISNILTKFKATNQHLAIVADEFGGFMGILTIEDIVEELVGDIFDETDEVILDYKELGENIYEVDGDMNIYDFFELVDYDDRDFESEYTTVGGWCTDMLEKFPEVGDTFEFANFTVTITEVEGMRVGKIKVEIQEMIDEEE